MLSPSLLTHRCVAIGHIHEELKARLTLYMSAFVGSSRRVAQLA